MTQGVLEETLKDLDDQRLFAQHREAVGLLAVSAGPKRDLFKSNQLRLRFEPYQGYLVMVHDLAVEEMLFRGFRHNTPLNPYDLELFPYYSPGSLYLPTSEEIALDREVLNERYKKHSEEVLLGKRRKGDFIRWTKRNPPEWLKIDTIRAIEKEALFLN